MRVSAGIRTRCDRRVRELLGYELRGLRGEQHGLYNMRDGIYDDETDGD